MWTYWHRLLDCSRILPIRWFQIFSSWYVFEILSAKIAHGAAPLLLSFAFSPDFVFMRAGRFSFCAELFSFSFSFSAGSKKVERSKKYFDVGVVGAKRRLARACDDNRLHRIIFDLKLFFLIHRIYIRLNIYPSPSIKRNIHKGISIARAREGFRLVRFWFAFGFRLVSVWFMFGLCLVSVWLGFGSRFALEMYCKLEEKATYPHGRVASSLLTSNSSWIYWYSFFASKRNLGPAQAESVKISVWFGI